MLIGVFVLVAQLGRSQEGTAVATGGLDWLGERDERLRDRFRQLLLHVPTRDLAAGWQLAVDVGRPAVAVLWKLLEGEPSDVNHRLVLLAAAMLAGGLHEDERLSRLLATPSPMLEERTLAALLVAIGPRRSRPMVNFWPRFLGPSKTPEDLLGIAVRLASVRFPGNEQGAPVLVDDDPGLAAATAFAGLPVPPSVTAKLWNLQNKERHAELFWRGALLGAARRLPETKPPAELLERARKLVRMQGEEMAATRAAAAWLLAVADELRPEGPRLPVPLLRVATSHAPTATRLSAWLEPTAQPRDEAPERLAVVYAWTAPPATVVAQRDQWSTNPDIARHIAVALALRLLGGGAPSPAIDVAVAGLPEWAFVRAASGARFERDTTCADERLQATLQLLADGRLEPPALALVLEEALWRWGSHPQTTPWELERLLVRDLLLAGSNSGGAKYQSAVRPDLRYSPSGMDRNDSFFPIAVKLFDFCWRPRAPLPPECRLAK